MRTRVGSVCLNQKIFPDAELIHLELDRLKPFPGLPLKILFKIMTRR